MARRRKAIRRRSSSKKSYFKRRKSSNKVKLIQPDAMVYGAVRAPLSNLLKQVTQNFGVLGFLGDVGDEVAVGTADYLIAKNTSGMVKNVAIKGLVVENAMAGGEISNLFMSGSKNNSSGSAW